MIKSELRKVFRAKRNAFSPNEVALRSNNIARQFFDKICLSAVHTLHTFIRIDKFCEVDTSLIYKRVWRDFPGILTAAPRSDLSSGEIQSVAFNNFTQWSENRWGILEPLDGEVIDAAQIDVVIVPLYCFDMHGHRVGYGKGMYDRLIARLRPDCLVVGVSHFPPVARIADTHEADVRLDVCITPDLCFYMDIKTGKLRPQ